MNYVSDFVFRQVRAIEPKGSQNLIDKSSLGVVVDNIKLIDLFSALYVPCIKSRLVPYVLFISFMLHDDYSSETKFLFFDKNLRIPDLLTLLSLCFGKIRGLDFVTLTSLSLSRVSLSMSLPLSLTLLLSLSLSTLPLSFSLSLPLLCLKLYRKITIDTYIFVRVTSLELGLPVYILEELWLSDYHLSLCASRTNVI